MGEREGEKHQCVVASHMPPTGDLPKTQACALTGNRTGDPLVLRLALNPLNRPLFLIFVSLVPLKFIFVVLHVGKNFSPQIIDYMHM